MSETYAKAKALFASGVIPIPTRGKKPIVDWTKVTVTDALIDQWQREGKWNGNLAVIVGEKSGHLVIVDFDGLTGYAAFQAQFPDHQDTYTVKTGSGNGYHVYYRVDLLPDNVWVKNIAALDGDNIEIRAQDVLCMVPPSIHPDTHQAYEIVNTSKAKRLTDLSWLVAWVKAYDPKPERVYPSTVEYDKNLNPKVLDALRRHFEAQDAKPAGDWRNNIHCPNPAHKDDNPSFGYNVRWGVGKCFGCDATFNTKNLCEWVGIDYKALGGLFEPETPPVPAAPRQTTAPEPPDVPPPPDTTTTPSRLFIRGREARNALHAEIMGEVEVKYPPIAMPYNFLIQAGEHSITAGRLVYFGAPSGGGKTTIMGLGQLRQIERGDTIIIRSDEWITEETMARDMEARFVHQLGGPTYPETALHLLALSENKLHQKWLQEEKAGIPIAKRKGRFYPAHQRHGRFFTDDQMHRYQLAKKKLDSFPGEMYYIPGRGQSVEQMLKEMTCTYEVAVSEGRHPCAFWDDYAQLLWLENEYAKISWMEQAMQKIKPWLAPRGMCGFIATQMNKTDVESVQQGADFDIGMMNYLRGDQANLVVMFVPELNYFVEQTSPDYGQLTKETVSWRHPLTGAMSQVTMSHLRWQAVKMSFGDPTNRVTSRGTLLHHATSLRVEDEPPMEKQKQTPMPIAANGHQDLDMWG